MIVLSNLAANLAQKEDAVTKYACFAQSEAPLGLALSAKENIPYGQSSAKLTVTRSLGHSVTWSLGHLVTRSLGHSVTWSLGHSVTQSLGHSVTQSLGHSDI